MIFANDAIIRSPRRILALALTALLAPLLMVAAGCNREAGDNGLARADAKYAFQVLDRAPEHGFAPGSFNIAAVHAAEDRHDPKVSAMLRASVIVYARAQHGLLIPTKARPAAWGAAPKAYDPAPEMDAAMRQGQFHQWLDAQAPKSPLYQTLQQAYVAAAAQPQTPQGAARLARLRANLERLRWLPRDEPATRVDVNIASASLIYVSDGQPGLTMRTASGKPGDETPMLASKIDNIVLNPPWNVPDEIAANELVPKGPDYLASHGFVTTDAGRLQQKPGPDSALGLVKFDFDNPYAVYLHDTPAKAAFDRAGRAVSHGCVRLERAVDLANLLLANAPGWSPARVQEVIASRETTTVKLPRPVPVRLMYLTVVPGPSGLVDAPDIYNWDAPLLALLDRYSRPAQRT
jgi:murein L,D-transpeptidase YcbB/YkuD